MTDSHGRIAVIEDICFLTGICSIAVINAQIMGKKQLIKIVTQGQELTVFCPD
jgi:hypothetical protein